MNIYVGRLPVDISEQALRDMFEQYGQVTSIKLIKDKFTGNLRGFGFVQMESNEQGEAAISELNGKEVNGTRIIVNEARPQEQREGGFRPSSSGRRFGGDRGGDRGGSRGGDRGGFNRDRGGSMGGNRW